MPSSAQSDRASIQPASRVVRVTQMLQRIFQVAATGVLVLLALGLIGLTALSAAGVLPWPELAVSFGGAPVEIGMWAQIALTVLVAALCAYVPVNSRVFALETSHRRFHMSMNDIARAYHAAHSADRAGAFRMSEQFDQVRERIDFLRRHPDLGAMEPEILEAAAQMSTMSRELAETYSDEKIDRARAFLRERQEEIANFNDRVAQAKSTTEELRGWVNEVELEESVARSQLARLKAELHDLLPELDLATQPSAPARSRELVPVNRLPAE